MLRAGDLTIESAGEMGVQRFEDVRDPVSVQNVLYQEMEDNENRKFDRVRAPAPGPAAPGPTSSSVADELTKLVNLHEQGHLTDAEFEAQKAAAARIVAAELNRGCRGSGPTHAQVSVTVAPALGRTIRPGSSIPGAAMRDDGTAEPSPGQAGPEHSGRRGEVGDEPVDCRGRHLEVVAQRPWLSAMSRPSVTTSPRDRASAGGPNAVALGADVAGPARAHRVVDRLDRVERRLGQRPRRRPRPGAHSARRSA